MKKVWDKPILEILSIDMTMGGNGKARVDCFDTDDDVSHPGFINDNEYRQFCQGS